LNFVSANIVKQKAHSQTFYIVLCNF